MSSYRTSWFLPLFLWLAILPFTPAIDISLSGHYYDAQLNQFNGGAFWQFIFDWGPWPAIATSVGALILCIAGLIIKKLRTWRRYLVLLALPLALGSGLVVHGILKEGWGRPRPRQIEAFGGNMPYHAVWQRGCPHGETQCKSFPCGHCTCGFYFFCLGMFGQRLKRRWLTITGYAAALIMGFLLSAARIAQGGHFFSDVITSALVMWYAALFCDWILFDWRRNASLNS